MEETFGPWCQHSLWLDEVYNATVTLGGRSRDLSPKEWQTMFGDDILAGIHKSSVIFFSQKLTKEQVEWGMQLDMNFHHNFLNRLQNGIARSLHLRPPLLKQGMNKQPCIALTNTTPNTQHETGTKRRNKEGNTNRNKQHKINTIRCKIPEDQKELVEKCYKAARSRNESFNIIKLMKCMVFSGKRSDFQKHLNLENKCKHLSIIGYCNNDKCQKFGDCLHQTTPYNIEKEKLKVGLNKFITGN